IYNTSIESHSLLMAAAMTCDLTRVGWFGMWRPEGAAGASHDYIHAIEQPPMRSTSTSGKEAGIKAINMEATQIAKLLGRLEHALAQADRLRRQLDQLILVDELDRGFQRERDRRGQEELLVGRRRPNVRQLLGLRRVHDQIVVARVDADDLPAIDLHARREKQ